MVIVGEKINTSLKGITEAIKAKDKEFIQELAVRQSKQGSDYIDVNCGTLIDVEEEMLPWLVEIVQEVVDKPCCIDSPNPKALEAALKVHKGVPMINSITAEKSRYDDVINLVKQYDAKIVALLIDDANGISPSDEVRTKIGIELINKMYEDGVPYENMYIDPLIQPISTDSNMGLVALNTIANIKQNFPEVHFMCGLSNISFGLPNRGLLNRTYLAMCMHAGLDGAVLDPGNRKMMGMIFAGEALLNKDRFTKKINNRGLFRMANYVEEIKELVIDGEDEEIVDKIKEAIDAGVSVGDIVNNGLIEAMNVIGPMMASGELFVPEVLMSAETMQVGLNYVKPLLQDGDLKSLGTVVIGTVEGDLHDIGKNLVAMMLESSGFTVINIGIDQSPQAFVDAIVENNAQIVGLSALLTTTMPAMRDTVALIKEKGLDVKVAVGGAPVNKEFADSIGADGYSEDATGAVALCKGFVGA